jgi:hypothetical protein
MKKLYIVCLLALLAVFVHMVMFHSRSAYAQQGGIRVDRIVFQGDSKTVTIPQVTGRVVGFSCAHFGEGPSGDCFIATSTN